VVAVLVLARVLAGSLAPSAARTPASEFDESLQPGSSGDFGLSGGGRINNETFRSRLSSPARAAGKETHSRPGYGSQVRSVVAVAALGEDVDDAPLLLLSSRAGVGRS